MRLLALDTSNEAMSVAVLDNDRLLAQTTINHERTHSEQLLPTIDDLVAASGLQPEDLDKIIVADGPGSYTGIRIAVTTGKTLAYTLNIALVGVSSLEVLAANITDTKAMIVPIMNARRNNVFTGVYQWDKGKLINVVTDRHVPLTLLLTELTTLRQPVIFVGSDAAMFRGQIIEALGGLAHFAPDWLNLPQALRLGQLGKDLPPVSVYDFVPRYLRLTEAENNWLKAHPGKGHDVYVEKV
ncbi:MULTISPECIES: tRNA (adenosine(37)-N6)-threonylcarbamoyltransferase complex dimerization subunit type 1 TsaB [Lacticaseibacillus]|uniref:tRNA (adenosine(37)-N6)-threonylcarbamoyltransferase complex dimerization subunit type 1 TsaB n=1 Tax=Lacticaseibacillus TaxID=2759736 RepID=UPI00063DB399|nr:MULTISPECIES: tRNA (adenosine(37)-N6)-threonylcarbamoyltransferase complex dimerization subunit type 1 TsaB [Lacticaseibacillus]KLI75914.1 peptidase M22 [Lacticaseibacillus casei]